MRLGSWKNRLGGLMLLVLATFSASAGGRGGAREQAESSMVVTGTIDIAPNGGVGDFALDKPEALPDSVKMLAAKVIPRWRFRPVVVDGIPVLARTHMSLRYVATPEADGKYRIRIRSAAFGGGTRSNGQVTVAKSMAPPHYPDRAQRYAIGGTVYVVLRVAHDGSVADAAVERVNLRIAGSDRQMQDSRGMLGNAVLEAARKWTFAPPTDADAMKLSFWDIRVPVTFLPFGHQRAAYGQWDTYVPGPAQRAPWLPPEQQPGSDALVAGGIYPAGQGPELLTDLAGEQG